MTIMEKIRTRFMLILGIFLAIDAGLGAYLIWPGSDSATFAAEERGLRDQKKLKTRQVEPLRNMDVRLLETREKVKKFSADKIPAHWSQISSELSKLAHANGVTLGGVQYKQEDTGIPNIRQIGIETAVAGDYGKLAHFINALERDKFLFVINQVALRAQLGGTVELQIIFETFLQEA